MNSTASDSDSDVRDTTYNNNGNGNDQSEAAINAANNLAALDLGSNSFHLMIVATDGEVITATKESVRLAAGIDEDGKIEPDTREQALTTLATFKAAMENHNVTSAKAVGTSTFRRIQDSQFLQEAEKALGIRISIISGESEASYIYQGAAQELADSPSRRLIIDIGGGSTELAIGRNTRLFNCCSIETGCVRQTRNHFADGRITADAVDTLYRRSLLLFKTYREDFASECWSTVAGTSGTLRAAYSAAEAIGLADNQRFNRSALETLSDNMLAFDHVKSLDLPGLSERRKAVFPAGLTILRALLAALDIEEVQIIRAALREGLIQELLQQKAADKKSGSDSTSTNQSSAS